MIRLWRAITGRVRAAGIEPSLLAFQLAVSGCLMAVATATGEYAWVVWISLFPLFVAVRLFSARAALLAGAFWGFCLYAFGFVWGGAVFGIDVSSLLLLMAVPGVYIGVAAYVTRRIGYNPVLLALGWIGVECGLRPLGMPCGLLAATQEGASLSSSLAGLFGYFFTVFLVALGNAVLLSVVSDLRFEVSRFTSLFEPVRSDELPETHIACGRSSFLFSPIRARAPPCMKTYRDEPFVNQSPGVKRVQSCI